MNAADILKRYESQKSQRSNVESMWSYMERFVMPYRAELYGRPSDEGKIDWRKRDIYDSTAPEAAEALAANLQGNLLSPSVKWFDLAFQDAELNQMDEPKEWLEECGTVIFNALQQSDFNLDAAEAILDMVGFGTMALVEEVDNETAELDFTAIPISEVFFEVGSKGQVLRFYRRLDWTALQIVDKFGDKDLPDDIKKAYESPTMGGTKFEICFCIYERKTVPKGLNTAKPMAVRAMPFGHKYVMIQGQKELGEEGGYPEMPVFITRWRTTAGSIWGNPPGFKLLPTIMDVNEAVEQILEGAGLDLEPPLMTTQKGIISQLDRSRGGISVVADINQVGELPGRGKADLSLLEINELRGQIRRGYYEDQLQLKESPAMTATEVNVRYELMQKLLGPTMGRLKVDFLDPLIYRTFMILFRAGKLPPPPQVVRERQAEYQVEYVGPLARAQKNETARNTAGWLGQIGSVAETYPDALDIPDWDKALRSIGQNSGVPMEYMVSEGEIQKKRKARQQRMEKQEKIQNMQAMGDAGQSVGAAAQSLPPEAISALQGAING